MQQRANTNELLSRNLSAGHVHPSPAVTAIKIKIVQGLIFLAIGEGLTLRVSQGQNETMQTHKVRKPHITVFSVHDFTTCYLNERPSRTRLAVFSAQPTEIH